MGREVRYVTADWEAHDEPLFDGVTFPDALECWEVECAEWLEGFEKNYGDGPDWKPHGKAKTVEAFEEWYGEKPDPSDYTSTRPDDDLTHIVMYENTSEGTPISPKFPNTPEGEDELARWLADNLASAFAGRTATYEQWLGTIRKGGWAPSAVLTGSTLRSGVALVGEGE